MNENETTNLVHVQVDPPKARLDPALQPQVDRLARASQEELALRRDALPAGRAHQQRRAQLGLQAVEGRAGGRRGQAQLASGRGQAARLDGGDEQLQVGQSPHIQIMFEIHSIE